MSACNVDVVMNSHVWKSDLPDTVTWKPVLRGVGSVTTPQRGRYDLNVRDNFLTFERMPNTQYIYETFPRNDKNQREPVLANGNVLRTSLLKRVVNTRTQTCICILELASVNSSSC